MAIRFERELQTKKKRPDEQKVLTLRHQQEREDLEKNMTLRRDKKKESLTRKLLEHERYVCFLIIIIKMHYFNLILLILRWAECAAFTFAKQRAQVQTPHTDQIKPTII